MSLKGVVCLTFVSRWRSVKASVGVSVISFLVGMEGGGGCAEEKEGAGKGEEEEEGGRHGKTEGGDSGGDTVYCSILGFCFFVCSLMASKLKV